MVHEKAIQVASVPQQVNLVNSGDAATTHIPGQQQTDGTGSKNAVLLYLKQPADNQARQTHLNRLAALENA